MGTRFEIEAMQAADWRDVSAIYAEGLATGVAAFMSKPPLWRDWNRQHLDWARLVARASGSVLGWAALRTVADS